MSTCREVNGKGEFAAEGNEAAGNVSTRHGAGVPSVDEQEDSFESNPNGIALICHDAKSFIQIPVDALDKHRIVVVPG